MKNPETTEPAKQEISKEEKVQGNSLAKKFYPPYMSRITSIINAIHKIHPKTSCWMTAKLLSVAGRKKLSGNDNAFYNGGYKKQHKIGNATFYTYAYGRGPAILMLHGWCSNGARWSSYVPQLVSLGYKVIIVDAPGHGKAPGRFLSVSLYVKGIKAILKSEEKWHAVITHSIAGLTGITAIGNSERKYHPTKFVMMNTFATVETMMSKFSRCLGVAEKVIKGTKEWMATYTDYPLEQFSISKHYKNIDVQGLLIYDTQDVVVPRAESNYILSHVQPLKSIKTEGLGHNLRSYKIVDEVLSFVKNKQHLQMENTTNANIAVCV